MTNEPTMMPGMTEPVDSDVTLKTLYDSDADASVTLLEDEQVIVRADGYFKTLHNSDADGTTKNVPDVKFVGNGDMFQLLCKASSESEGWMKSTKAMQVSKAGCVIQVTTQQRNSDGSYSVAEALTFVPNVRIEDDENGGRRLTG